MLSNAKGVHFENKLFNYTNKNNCFIVLQKRADRFSVKSHSLQRTYWPSKLQLIIPSSCSFIGISPPESESSPYTLLNLFFADTTGIIATEIIMFSKIAVSAGINVKICNSVNGTSNPASQLEDKRGNEIYQC